MSDESWDTFPKRIVATLEQLASASAWLAANEREGNDEDAARDKANIELYTRELGKLLDDEECTSNTHYLLVDLFKFGAWHAANERYGYKKDSEKDLTKVGERGGAGPGQAVLPSAWPAGSRGLPCSALLPMGSTFRARNIPRP